VGYVPFSFGPHILFPNNSGTRLEILAFSWTVIGRKDTDVNARSVATEVRFVSFG
jgi:hypothetical protein